MSEEFTKRFSESNPNKLDLILLTLQRLKEDLHISKCEIKTALREVTVHQETLSNSVYKLRRDFSDFSERLHGLELKQDRENSTT